MNLIIESGIPVPDIKGLRGLTAALRKLKEGESTVIDMPQYRISAHAKYAFGKGNYATRKTEHGTRVWRLK